MSRSQQVESSRVSAISRRRCWSTVQSRPNFFATWLVARCRALGGQMPLHGLRGSLRGSMGAWCGHGVVGQRASEVVGGGGLVVVVSVDAFWAVGGRDLAEATLRHAGYSVWRVWCRDAADE